MSNKLSSRTKVVNRGIAICLCLLALYTSTTLVAQKDALAQDKSTSITCNDNLPCEKTVCIDGDCETTVSNSSQISPIQEFNATDSDDDGSDDTENSIRDTIAERMSLRDD